MKPMRMARTAGALYLVNILLGAFAIGFAPSSPESNETLFRLGLAAHVVVTLTNIGLALLFYELFRVVNRPLAMLVVLFTLVATAIEAGAVAGQLAAMSSANVQFATAGYDVSTGFFGGGAITIGWLTFRSTFLPRAIGVLMVIDGVAYLVNALATIIAPGFAAHLVPYIQLPTLFGEGSLCLWLLIVGVDASRWNALAHD